MFTSDVGPYSILPRWLLDAGLSDRAVRLFATLANYADRDSDIAHPGRKELAARLGRPGHPVSLDSVDRAKRELVRAGAIVVVPWFDPQGQRANRYRLMYRNPAATQPHVCGGTQPHHSGSELESEGTRGSSSSKGEAQLDLVGRAAATPPERRIASTVGGREVSRQEDAMAKGILEAFNRTFGKDFRSRDHYAGIVMRIRERPDLTLEDHAALVEKVHAGEHWWRGSPTPRLIYGSSRALDAALNREDGDEGGPDLSVYAGPNV